MNKILTPILIVGGGPVGLAAALQLSRLGVNSLLIERNATTTNHPKARGVNIRSMELIQQWGIESAMRLHELPDEAKRFVWTSSLQSHDFISVEKKDDKTQEAGTSSALVSQDWVEHELYHKLSEYDCCQVLFNTKLISLKQNEHEVMATAVNSHTGEELSITCQYLIAADGAHSCVREWSGINMHGEPNLGDFCGIYCEADLTQLMSDKQCAVLSFIDKRMPCVILSVDGKTKWIFSFRYFEEQGETKETFTDAYCIQKVKSIIDDSSVSVKLINRKFWQMAALNADSYQNGRVFLAGDAAHRVPPTGGFGMNLGIQDAHNIAWKLAYVINGWASPDLLQSYHQERHDVVSNVIKWSMKNAERMVGIYTALYQDDWKTAETLIHEQHAHVNSIGLDIGFIYPEGCLIRDAGDSYDYKVNQYVPNTLPGCRAPCIKLQHENEDLTSLNLFEKEFVFLTAETTGKWHTPVQATCNALKLPYKIYTIGEQGDYKDIHNDFLDKYQLSPEGLVLVRPDGHVAWRSQSTDDANQKKLNHVVNFLLKQE